MMNRQSFSTNKHEQMSAHSTVLSTGFFLLFFPLCMPIIHIFPFLFIISIYGRKLTTQVHGKDPTAKINRISYALILARSHAAAYLISGCLMLPKWTCTVLTIPCKQTTLILCKMTNTTTFTILNKPKNPTQININNPKHFLGNFVQMVAGENSGK